jgi:hypothetical protein
MLLRKPVGPTLACLRSMLGARCRMYHAMSAERPSHHAMDGSGQNRSLVI